MYARLLFGPSSSLITCVHSRKCFFLLSISPVTLHTDIWPWPSNFIKICQSELACQISWSKVFNQIVITWTNTHTHTTDQLLYKDHEVFGNNNKIKKLSHNISTVGNVQILQLQSAAAATESVKNISYTHPTLLFNITDDLLEAHDGFSKSKNVSKLCMYQQSAQWP